MVSTVMYLVSDDNETIEKARSYWQNFGVTVHVFSHAQWNSNLESPNFKQQISTGAPSLAAGLQPLEGGKVLQFPSTPSHVVNSKVSTMNELESQAIQNAISQFRGNLTEAARALGIGRATLYRKVKQYNIDPSAARKKRAA